MLSSPGRPSAPVNPADRRERARRSLRCAYGSLEALVHAKGEAAARATNGLWRRDPATWSADTAVQRSIANRLGWLTAPSLMAGALERLRRFSDEVRHDGITDVVLLGMGGSSLAPEVLRAILGVATGFPRFQVLDSTDPASVRAAATPPPQTLYVLASKSGTTIEPNSLATHFEHRLKEHDVPDWARHFVAITDEGTALATRARDEGFRETFVNPSDIGGRFSALSYFGLVPAALMGQDLDAIVGWGEAMLAAAEPGAGDIMANPAAGLGLLMGAAARAGRDKLTLVLPDTLEPFGLWVEQLVAESTGKAGVGIVPICGEREADGARRGSDRLYVRVNQVGLPAASGAASPDSNQPGADIDLPEPAALGAEFVRWEIATAVAGALLGVNPFDEPNVQQAKDATRLLLAEYTSAGRLPVTEPDATSPNGTTTRLTTAARRRLGDRGTDGFLTTIGPGDYFTLLAYLGPDLDLAAALREWRDVVHARTGAATSIGMGPRYLHSTGQLHKGGANGGVFVLVTATPEADVAIPGSPFSFGTLELAQALGDFASLEATGRRALHVHLPAPDAALVREASASLLARLPRA